MNKAGRYIGVIALVMIFASACKKDDKTSTPACYWHIDDKSHSGDLATRVALNGLESKESATELFTVYFASYPAAGKEYKIVNYVKLGALDSNECIVQVDHSGDLLVSTGYDNVKAGIEVAANGKLTVTIPKTWALHYSSGLPQGDSVMVDGFMTER